MKFNTYMFQFTVPNDVFDHSIGFKAFTYEEASKLAQVYADERGWVVSGYIGQMIH